MSEQSRSVVRRLVLGAAGVVGTLGHLGAVILIVVALVGAWMTPAPARVATWVTDDAEYRNVDCQLGGTYAHAWDGRHYSFCRFAPGNVGIGAFDPHERVGYARWPLPEFSMANYAGLRFDRAGRFGAVVREDYREGESRFNERRILVGMGNEEGWVAGPVLLESGRPRTSLHFLGMGWRGGTLHVVLATAQSSLPMDKRELRLVTLAEGDDDGDVRSVPMTTVCQRRENCIVRAGGVDDDGWFFVVESSAEAEGKVSVESVREDGTASSEFGVFPADWAQEADFFGVGHADKPLWFRDDFEFVDGELKTTPDLAPVCTGSFYVTETGALRSSRERCGPRAVSGQLIEVGDETLFLGTCSEWADRLHFDLCLSRTPDDPGVPVAEGAPFDEFGREHVEIIATDEGGYLLFTPSGQFARVDANLDRVDPPGPVEVLTVHPMRRTSGWVLAAVVAAPLLILMCVFCGVRIVRGRGGDSWRSPCAVLLLVGVLMAALTVHASAVVLETLNPATEEIGVVEWLAGG